MARPISVLEVTPEETQELERRVRASTTSGRDIRARIVRCVGISRLTRLVQGRPMYPFAGPFLDTFKDLQKFFWDVVGLYGLPHRSDRFQSDGMDLEAYAPLPPGADDPHPLLLVRPGMVLRLTLGYCPSTDWHWQIKEAMGETGLPNSFIKYYMDRLTGKDWDPDLLEGLGDLLDASVVFFGVAALGISAWVNWRDWRRQADLGTPDW